MEVIVFEEWGKWSGGKQQASSFHEEKVVSCPISPDRAEEMRATGTPDINNILLEVPTVKGKNGPQKMLKPDQATTSRGCRSWGEQIRME